MIKHTRGDTFDYIANIPDTFADGFFVGWEVSCHIRSTQSDRVIGMPAATWGDPSTTRTLHLLLLDTTSWPLGQAEFDVQFRRLSDGYRLSTKIVYLDIIKDVTQI